jgi:inosine-uridine nucleoside N-ribohydrolase
MANKLIIDTDIGTYYDDAFAVLLGARSPEVQLLGVTTNYGDTHLRSRIARKILNVAGRQDVPVFRGIGKPLRGNALMFGFEGERILDEEDKNIKYDDEHAVNFIIRSIMENPGEVTVVTLGAVSNLAAAYIMEPRIAQNVKEVIMMAGVITPIIDQKGVRRSPVEEYNFNTRSPRRSSSSRSCRRRWCRSTSRCRSRCAPTRCSASMARRARWRSRWPPSSTRGRRKST